MILRTLLIWTVGATALGYTPTAPEILSRMEAALAKAAPVQVQVVREDRDGTVLEEAILSVPAAPGSMDVLRTTLSRPFVVWTLPTEELLSGLAVTAPRNEPVSLGRLDGKICYIIQGKQERMWIRKDDLLPLKVEILSGTEAGTVYLYRDMVRLSEAVMYPSRTEVLRNGELLFLERIRPSAAAPVSGP